MSVGVRMRELVIAGKRFPLCKGLIYFGLCRGLVGVLLVSVTGP